MFLQPLLFSILFASLFLNLCIFFSRLTALLLQIEQGVPTAVIKPVRTHLLDIFELILQTELWEVLLPAILYSLIYSFIPLSGVKAGLFVGLLLFLLGSLPDALWLGTNLRLSLAFWLHQLLWRLIKLFLIFGTFGYFFN